MAVRVDQTRHDRGAGTLVALGVHRDLAARRWTHGHDLTLVNHDDAVRNLRSGDGDQPGSDKRLRHILGQCRGGARDGAHDQQRSEHLHGGLLSSDDRRHHDSRRGLCFQSKSGLHIKGGQTRRPLHRDPGVE